MSVVPVLADLAACLCAELSAAPTPDPCFCGVVPGEVVAVDLSAGCTSKNGVAWVRISNGYPSTVVGQQDTRPANCRAGTGYDIEMGVLRENEAWLSAESITEAQSLAAVDLQHSDMRSMQRAILCCTALQPEDYILGQYRPMGPQGGMIGGAWVLHASPL